MTDARMKAIMFERFADHGIYNLPAHERSIIESCAIIAAQEMRKEKRRRVNAEILEDLEKIRRML